ncbi:diphthine synthase [Gregarina niphandrodes]|uniref:diphthine methyl ester synthase n=1 Tax=Gregarina niphandrodes TaxID=110365 RepID=A0A023BC27_GRENI|nr:diphthine synthase [Gregarina niphandrodes]EZG81182.1 diphthine synthase [Gregarina niphandrodes]|eukprot:XP_011134240.1 diphthine synthase [Gregarina niphandrodes]
MVLYLVGLGLGSLDDVTVRGAKALDESSYLYLEAYTSVQEDLSVNFLKERYPTKEVIEADRTMVESACDDMLERAKNSVVSFLVVGDPFGATTHADLFLRAKEMGVEIKIFHNTSIINAVGTTGLQLYRFGQVVSIPFFDGTWRPTSFVDKILENFQMGLHTLALLDIKVKEQSVENMIRQRPIFEPPRFMTVNQAVEQILSVLSDRNLQEDNVQQVEKHILTPQSLACGVARVGCKDQVIRFGTLEELRHFDFGRELHSVIICAPELHEIEESFRQLYSK